MAGKNTAVFGIYRTREAAERGVDALRQAGFRNEDISVLLPENQGTKDFVAEKHTKAPEGTAAGATAGAIIGGTLGLLAGIGALAIPGMGPLIAAGPIMATLSGIGAGGVVGGMLAPWWAWACRSTKPSVTRARFVKEVSWFPSTATIRIG